METITKNAELEALFTKLGIRPLNPAYSTGQHWGGRPGAETRDIHSPIDGSLLATVKMATQEDYEAVIMHAQAAFQVWQRVPAPKRGEVVRQIGDRLRAHKAELGQLVTWEMGKILQEGLGEVQEMIDICDFAVGLSRQLHGLTMHSERPDHRMYEQYHPLGVVGIISAFNFPVAVWSWNAMLAAVCGNVCVWKPSEKTPLTALACQHIVAEVLRDNQLPEGIFNLVIGGPEVGQMLSADARVPLVSATGSTRMGKKVAQAVAGRLGRSILELGGNNAIIITEFANLDMALRAVVFGAVGTCGQRCTTARRLIVHADVYDDVKERLVHTYRRLPIGNPLKAGNLVGPLIDQDAVENFKNALAKVQAEGGRLLVGGQVLPGVAEKSNYVAPAIVEAENHFEMVQEETFAPILYLIKYRGGIQNAVDLQNGVRQGLSSAIFTNHLQEAENFLAAWGSDCGIANVNIGTSGAEIGGAFGGEKETGGGRESGSDAWKAYMRRQTNTINYGTQLPLAQGIKFDI
jgi:aldehyde dehydrogenase (NAD+)